MKEKAMSLALYHVDQDAIKIVEVNTDIQWMEAPPNNEEMHDIIA